MVRNDDGVHVGRNRVVVMRTMAKSAITMKTATTTRELEGPWWRCRNTPPEGENVKKRRGGGADVVTTVLMPEVVEDENARDERDRERALRRRRGCLAWTRWVH